MNKRIYQERKDNHLCTMCGASDERTINGFATCTTCAAIAREYNKTHKEYLKTKNKTSSDTICWHCKHAVPKIEDGKYTKGCEWSIKHEPVPGWITNACVDYRYPNGKIVKSYSVKSCPKFKEG